MDAFGFRFIYLAVNLHVRPLESDLFYDDAVTSNFRNKLLIALFTYVPMRAHTNTSRVVYIMSESKSMHRNFLGTSV